MEMNEILSNLCAYDIRNPLWVKSDYTDEELKEKGYQEKAKENCLCNNCFYGRSRLAEYILELLKSEQC